MKGYTTTAAGINNRYCVELVGDVFNQNVKFCIFVLLCNFLR